MPSSSLLFAGSSCSIFLPMGRVNALDGHISAVVVCALACLSQTDIEQRAAGHAMLCHGIVNTNNTPIIGFLLVTGHGGVAGRVCQGLGQARSSGQQQAADCNTGAPLHCCCATAAVQACHCVVKSTTAGTKPCLTHLGFSAWVRHAGITLKCSVLCDQCTYAVLLMVLHCSVAAMSTLPDHQHHFMLQRGASGGAGGSSGAGSPSSFLPAALGAAAASSAADTSVGTSKNPLVITTAEPSFMSQFARLIRCVASSSSLALVPRARHVLLARCTCCGSISSPASTTQPGLDA